MLGRRHPGGQLGHLEQKVISDQPRYTRMGPNPYNTLLVIINLQVFPYSQTIFNINLPYSQRRQHHQMSLVIQVFPSQIYYNFKVIIVILSMHFIVILI